MFVVLPATGWALEPIYVRLSFWIASEQTAEFTVFYSSRILPLLKDHGFEPSLQTGRFVSNGGFARLFKVSSPNLLNDLYEVFGNRSPDPATDHPYMMLYSAPARSQTKQIAEAGRKQRVGIDTGYVQSYGVEDGLMGTKVSSIMQDSTGSLWLATNGGVIRYGGTCVDLVSTRSDCCGRFEVGRYGTCWWFGRYTSSRGWYT